MNIFLSQKQKKKKKKKKYEGHSVSSLRSKRLSAV